jgi:hypothetical protein
VNFFDSPPPENHLHTILLRKVTIGCNFIGCPSTRLIIHRCATVAITSTPSIQAKCSPMQILGRLGQLPLDIMQHSSQAIEQLLDLFPRVFDLLRPGVLLIDARLKEVLLQALSLAISRLHSFSPCFARFLRLSCNSIRCDSRLGPPTRRGYNWRGAVSIFQALTSNQRSR